MAPGIDGLPAAEREVEVAAPVATFLRSLSPRMLVRVRLGLRALEWLPFPWRFSRLDCASREDFLWHMEGSRRGLVHELLLMAKVLSTLGYVSAPGVGERIGVRTECRLAASADPEPAGPLGDTSPPAAGAEECDVAIVGSGAGGAVAATVLAEAGLDVVVLEAGRSFDRESYPSDPLAAIAELYRDGGLTVAEGRPAIPVPVGRAVGGTTVINSGTCFRAPDAVLKDWRERFGVGWATGLEAEFAAAEDFLRVHRSTPSGWGATASWRWRAPRRSAPQAARSLATRATACSAAPARWAARSTPSAACTSAISPARSPPERGCERASKPVASSSRKAERSASTAGRWPCAHGWRRSSPAERWGRLSCCCARGLAADRSAATSTSTPPAGSALAMRRRCV